MRRFGRAFLTISVALTLTINLILIVLYGRQFYAQCSEDQGSGSLGGVLSEGAAMAAENCLGAGESAQYNLVLVNVFIIALLVFIWVLIRHYYHQHSTMARS